MIESTHFIKRTATEERGNAGSFDFTYAELKTWADREPKLCFAAMNRVPVRSKGPKLDPESRRGDVQLQAFELLTEMLRKLKLMQEIYSRAIEELLKSPDGSSSAHDIDAARTAMEKRVTVLRREAPQTRGSAGLRQPQEICGITGAAAKLVMDTWNNPLFQTACRYVWPDPKESNA